ncbi:MAG: Rrf2 family transcriptional regulator [Verrucomicrobiales bacterium]|nr:Rrf2 family transcriptional regulator [Verrucomicrobiales bacterium]
MKISKKAEYALRSIVAIAKRPATRPVSIQELVAEEAIPVKFLEQILLSLKHGGLLISKRGVGGGYRLAKTPDQISVGQILTLIDGAFAPLPDINPQSGLSICFSELEKLVNDFLSTHSIADIISKEREDDAMAFDI